MELRAQGAAKKFFRKTGEANFFYAVKETDFILKPGALTEIIGKSGSGKSTFLNMLGGLLAPSAGKVFLGDTDLYALPDRALSALRNRQIGVVPQGQTGLDSLTALENVMLPFSLYEKKSDCADAARQLLERVGIAALANAYPNELSGGELRRLAIARALINQPPVILADEPTGDLDEENTETVLRLLRELADAGAAVLLVTHEHEAMRYADEIYQMRAGALSACRTEPTDNA